MKKWKKRNLFLIVLMLVFTFIPINGQAATKVDLNKTKATMYVGNTITLKVKGTNKKVAWSSGNKKVATVSSKGKVTAKKKGTATITAKVSGKKYKCMITVKETAPTHTHSYQWIETKEPTCSLEGEKVYQCECGKIEETEVIPKLEHKYSHGTITIPVTCEKEGEKAFKCTRSGCNEIKKEPIPKTDHTPGDWVVTKEATETDTGEKVKKCMVCEVVVETGIVDKLAHSHKYSWETNGDSRTMNPNYS